MDNIFLYITAILLSYLTVVSSLECFACDEEDWNHNDCTHKRQQCDPFQDACTTYIRFGVPENFDVRNFRRYFISKGCDTQSGCNKRLDATSSACQRSYANDWACIECCTENLCNFPVKHLAGNSIKASVMVTICAAVFAVWNKL